jgi:hypothetical protein
MMMTFFFCLKRMREHPHEGRRSRGSSSSVSEKGDGKMGALAKKTRIKACHKGIMYVRHENK